MRGKVPKVSRFRLLFFVFCILFLPLAASAAVSQIGAATSANNTNTLSFTVPAGTNRILLVVASENNGLSVPSVTFGASPLTLRASHNDGFAADTIWTLSMGTSGSPTTATITAGTTPNIMAFIGAAAFQGVDQTTPTSGVQKVNNLIAPSASNLTVVSTSGSLIFDIFDTYRAGLSTNTTTPNGGQTALHNSGAVTLDSGGFGFYRTSTKPGGASVSTGWTSSNGEALIHIALSINALPSPAGVTLSGRVATAEGQGIRNAVVTLTDSNGAARSTQTGTFGYYSFDGVEVGATYLLQVAGKRFSFSNPSRVVIVNDQLGDLDFISDPK